MNSEIQYIQFIWELLMSKIKNAFALRLLTTWLDLDNKIRLGLGKKSSEG